MKKDARRVKPVPSAALHAHPVDEAIAIEDDPLPILVSGNLCSGTAYQATVHVPQGFSYLMMKLSAYGDRKHDAAKEMARHHALDLYRIVAMLTEPEYAAAQRLRRAHRESDHVKRAATIVATDFADEESGGSLRLRAHPLFRREWSLEEFLAVLKELFVPR